MHEHGATGMWLRDLRYGFRCAILLLLAGILGAGQARADATLLVEQPFGEFGAMNPTGHAAVYLDNICADVPTRLRACRDGEAGVVVSRYHKVAGYDWLAIPIIPYLYAVDRVEDVPETITPELEEQLRDAYRREHLRSIQPDDADGGVPGGEWVQLIGSSYDRSIHAFRVRTTAEQDARFIAEFNDRKNVSHFNLFFNNCADLSRGIMNFYYPHAIGRNFIADLGFTTPKQAAKRLVKYDRKHPETHLQEFMIPQVPGTTERSRPVRGVAEALVRSKRYLVPLGYFQPELTGVLAAAYVAQGRFRFPKDVHVMTPMELAGSGDDETAPVLTARTPLATASGQKAVLATSTPTETTVGSGQKAMLTMSPEPLSEGGDDSAMGSPEF